MIVRDLTSAEASGRHIVREGWNSTRLLLRNDTMGCSFHITTVHEGAELNLHFEDHLESVYCISGEGEIQDLADGTVYAICPGTFYILDQHDQHVLRATKEMKMACVFNPPSQREGASAA